jgi:hypothetical protein
MRFAKSAFFSALAITMAILCADAVHAQDDKKQKKLDATMRSLQGVVSDADGKLISGAIVQLKDMRTLAVRSFSTQETGEYHFSGLKLDNDYQVKADYNDKTSGPKTISVFDTQKVLVRNLKLDKKKP